MGILGIRNRTENWQTVKKFVPFIESDDALAVLVATLNEKDRCGSADLLIELFWTGMRDYCHAKRISQEDLEFKLELQDIYNDLFPDLRSEIVHIEEFKQLKPHNYRVDSPERRSEFTENLLNTEIDIVIQSPSNIYIGEAKVESDFDSKSEYVLVHQLVRQYVMAKILAELTDPKRDVVPFVVCENENTRRKAQVRFMQRYGGLRRENVLIWRDIDDIRHHVR